MTDPDIFIVADGSGTVASKACGWAAHGIFRGEIQLFCGCSSVGTNNFAELTPFLVALWFYSQLPQLGGVAPSVQLVSDSEVIVRCGNKEYERRANGSLWAQIEFFEKAGWQLHWEHIPRNSTVIHQALDGLSRQMRKKMEAMLMAGVAPTHEGRGEAPHGGSDDERGFHHGLSK